jgi:hypothetical protein
MQLPIPVQLNLNSILVILIGIGSVIVGGVLGLLPAYRILGVGLFAMGIGTILFGATNGFSDPSPTGRLLFRIALIAYFIGTPIVAYEVYGLAMAG